MVLRNSEVSQLELSISVCGDVGPYQRMKIQTLYYASLTVMTLVPKSTNRHCAILFCFCDLLAHLELGRPHWWQNPKIKGGKLLVAEGQGMGKNFHVAV